MRSYKTIGLFTCLLVLFAFALPGCLGLMDPLPSKTSYQQRRLGINYSGTTGQVGHHMYASPKAHCGATWQKSSFKHLSGSLPAGLRFKGSRLEGTPSQPGKWQIRVKFSGVKCKGRRYADEVVTIYLTIKGYAPRKLR
jgi:hypothetical protein